MLGVAPISHGKWQKIFFESGPEAAQDYCFQMISLLDRTCALYERVIRRTADRQELCAVGQRLYTLSVQRQWRYDVDGWGEKKVFLRGRGEPGRTPFNYPDHKHRFDGKNDLLNYFERKIRSHAECYLLLNELIGKCREEDEKLKSEQQRHSRCVWKWRSRFQPVIDSPDDFLLPFFLKTPFEMMNIDWLHQSGYKGKGAQATLLEQEDADRSHPALEGVFADGEGKMETEVSGGAAHATRAAGIIAARWNPHYNHRGVVPEATLHILEFSQQLRMPSSDIVTHSTRFCYNFGDGFAAKDQEELYRHSQELLEYGYRKVTSNRLLIMTNGNRGVAFDRNPALCSEEDYYLKDPTSMDLCIRVVNLQRNGLYPLVTATLPGKKWAELSVCAIAHDVLTIEVGGGYRDVHGAVAATAFVTGIALALQGGFPWLSKEQIRRCILEGATPILLNERFEPELVSRDALGNYSRDQIARSQEIFGQGIADAQGAVAKAQECTDSLEVQSFFL